jgi:hypothetical protein
VEGGSIPGTEPPWFTWRELLDFASVGVLKGLTMKAHQALAFVALTLLLGGSVLSSASAQAPSAPPSQPTEPQPPAAPQQPGKSEQPAGSQQDSKAEAELARKAARARMARCKDHPEVCRQQTPK